MNIGVFLVGTACAQKYTIWIFAITIPITIGMILGGYSRKTLFKTIVTAVVIIVACVVPHMAKNIIWTNNPVAPFAKDLFPSQNIYAVHQSDSSNMSFVDVPKLPLILFFNSPTNALKLGPFPLLILIGIPLFLLAAKKPTNSLIIFYTAIFQLSFWIIVRQSDWLVPRFVMTPIALLLVVSSIGIQNAVVKWPFTKQFSIVLICIMFWTLGIWPRRHWRASWPFVLGLENRAAWHERYAPVRGYPVLHRVAASLDSKHRLLIGGSYYNIPVESLPYISTEKEWVIFSKLPNEERLRYLKVNVREHIT